MATTALFDGGTYEKLVHYIGHRARNDGLF